MSARVLIVDDNESLRRVVLGVVVFEEVLRGAEDHRLLVLGSLAAAVAGVCVLAAPTTEPAGTGLSRTR